MGMLAIKREREPRGSWLWPVVRRHEFVAVIVVGLNSLPRGLTGYECRHCLTHSELSDWGLTNLSVPASRCASKKAPRIGLLEWLRNSVNCSYTRTIREL